MSWKELSWDCLPPALQNAIYILLKKLNIPFKKEEIRYISWSNELIEVNGLKYGTEWIEDSYNWWDAYEYDWSKEPIHSSGYTGEGEMEDEVKEPIHSSGYTGEGEMEDEVYDVITMLDTFYEIQCIKTPLRLFHGTSLQDMVVQEICKKLPEWLKGIETSEGEIIDVEVVKTPEYPNLIYFGGWDKDPCESVIEIDLSENKGYLKFKLDPQNKGSEKCVFEDTLEVFDEEIPVEVNIYS